MLNFEGDFRGNILLYTFSKGEIWLNMCLLPRSGNISVMRGTKSPPGWETVGDQSFIFLYITLLNHVSDIFSTFTPINYNTITVILPLSTYNIICIICTFLCHVMYSSLRTAFRKLCNLYWGCTKHLAAETMAAVSGPVTPVAVKNSATLGVRRNGTGRLASKSPKKFTFFCQ